MKWQIQKRKVTINGNTVLVTALSRREAEEFRAKMAEVSGDDDRTNEIVLELVERNVTFEDGEKIDVGDIPNGDLIALFREVIGGKEAGVADFSKTP